MLRVVSWNIARRRRPLEELREMDVDLALLQEVGSGAASSLPDGMETGGRGHWDSYNWARDYPEGRFGVGRNRWPMVVRLSNRAEIEWFEQVGPDRRPEENELSVSDVGLIAAARVIPRDPEDGEPFIAASMYALWNPTDGATKTARSITSDLSSLLDRGVPFSHRILAAGDLNMWHGEGAFIDMQSLKPVETMTDRFEYLYRIYREGDRFTAVIHRPNGDAFRIQRRRWKTLWGTRRWVRRNMEAGADLRRRVTSGETRLEPGVWSRMSALGLEFMGPQYPNGRQAYPVPEFMPSDTGNVVTFHRPGQAVEDADQQLDYVFALRGFHESVSTRALNSVEQWGSSDHCRILIELAGRWWPCCGKQGLRCDG